MEFEIISAIYEKNVNSIGFLHEAVDAEDEYLSYIRHLDASQQKPLRELMRMLEAGYQKEGFMLGFSYCMKVMEESVVIRQMV